MKMKVFLSKKEIESLSKEDYYILRDYGCKESILTELISIKVYNLIKNNLTTDNSYVNRVFSLSSFCPDINLSDYDIKDVDIMIKFKDNILSGFMSKKEKNFEEAFITIVTICDNLILSTNEKSYDVLPKPAVITNLLSSNNIEYISSLCRIAKLRLDEQFREEFKDKFTKNLVLASRLRKESFDNISEENKKTLLQTTFSGQHSTSEYIYKLSERYLPDLFENFVTKMLDELKNKMSADIKSVEKLYEKASSYTDQILIDFLYSPVPNYASFNSDLKIIDLIFVKDELEAINKGKYEIENKKKVFQSKIDKFNDLIHELNLEIHKACPRSMEPKIFEISHSDMKRIPYHEIFSSGATLEFDGNEYYLKGLYYWKVEDFATRHLCNLLYLEKNLNLKITHKWKTIYTIPEELKNKLIEAKNDVLDMVPVSYRDKLCLR